MLNKVTLKFCGGAKTVTGANYLLETGETKILVDCGMFQGPEEVEKLNRAPFSYNPAEIDYLLITHAHLDHIGRIPKLINEGFKGKIIATAPTVDLTHLMLEDSQRVLEQESERIGAMPIFGYLEVDKIMGFFQGVNYGKKVELAKDINCIFRDAGHVLGSAMIEIFIGKKKIVFSGDMGNPKLAFSLLNRPSIIEQADYVVIESAYGDTEHATEKEAKDLLEDVVESTLARKGVLMIPTMALERTQQILYHLNELAKNKRIPYVPIYVDSPLAIRLMDVYKKYVFFLGKEAQEILKKGEGEIFRFPGLAYTVSIHESKMINRVPAPKIIMAGSGMSEGGRILYHEIRYLPEENSTLLMVSFQAENTLGKRILDGAKEVQIMDHLVPVKASVKFISGYSAHADQPTLLEWLGRIKKPLQKIFVAQGDENDAMALKHAIRDNLGLAVEVPELDEVFEL